MSKIYKELDELEPKAREACALFLNRCKTEGIKIFITETYRSQERQDELYAQGRTEPGKIVTWTKNSRHTSRRAWDIACEGSDPYNRTILRKAGDVGRKMGLIWGGDWEPPDMPHFEMPENWSVNNGEEETDMTEADIRKIVRQEFESILAERDKKPVSDWAKKEMETAEAEGITDGSSPQAFATREQVAAMIVRSQKQD